MNQNGGRKKHSAMLRAYTWLCARGSLLVGLREQFAVPALRQGWHTKQDTVNAISGPGVFYPGETGVLACKAQTLSPVLFFQHNNKHVKVYNLNESYKIKWIEDDFDLILS